MAKDCLISISGKKKKAAKILNDASYTASVKIFALIFFTPKKNDAPCEL